MTKTKLLLAAALSSIAVAGLDVAGAAAQSGRNALAPELRRNQKPHVKVPSKKMCYRKKTCVKTPKGLICTVRTICK